MGKYVPDELTPLTEREAAIALKIAFEEVFGSQPSLDTLAVLWAKTALETGRFKSIHNYNWGNIKKFGDNDWTMFRCNELLNGKLQWFDPPHLQTHFCAFPSASEGAREYLIFVGKNKRYQKAWNQALMGDPYGYSKALKEAGYYTASEALYTKGVVALCEEFKRKYSDVLDEPIPTWTPEQLKRFQENQDLHERIHSGISDLDLLEDLK